MHGHLVRGAAVSPRRSCAGPVVLALLGPLLAYAQPETPRGGPDTRPAKGTLGERYVEGSFGFAFNAPAGCVVSRQKEVLENGDLQLVKFVNLADAWSLTARFSPAARPLSPEMIIEGITADLEAHFTDVKALRRDAAPIASREGVRCAATFVAERLTMLRQQATIRIKPAEYLALVFLTPASDQEVATKLFDEIVASFEILRSEAQEQQIVAGLERGAQLLAKVAADPKPLADRAVAETYLWLLMDGKEVGFVEVLERPETRERREGIRVRQVGWVFRAEGQTTQMIQDVFLANDLAFEVWVNRVVTLTVPKPTAPRQAILDVEQGVRQDDQLVVWYTPQPGAPELLDKVIEVDKSCAPAAWHGLLPRLINLNEPQLYAFSSYNSDRRGTILRVYRVGPTTHLTHAGRRVPAVKLEDSEGLIPPLNEIHVDKDGRLLRVSAASVEMIATTREDVTKKYKAQVEQTDALLRKLPIREPTPRSDRRPPPALR